jgi:hypothetical protein
MNCFVIMPFAEEFDDVYGVIKQVVESATGTNDGRCFRLDEARPAGRITDRLLGELRSATLCVADITGAKPNVIRSYATVENRQSKGIESYMGGKTLCLSHFGHTS